MSLVVETIFDYDAKEEDEISFKKGDCFDVIDKYDDGWWYIKSRIDAHKGLAPSNYLTTANLVPEETVDVVIPDGWKQYIDKDSKDFYYHNIITGAVQWEFPINSNKEIPVISEIPNKVVPDVSELPKLVKQRDEDEISMDLMRFKELRQITDAKINELRVVVSNNEKNTSTPLTGGNAFSPLIQANLTPKIESEQTKTAKFENFTENPIQMNPLKNKDPNKKDKGKVKSKDDSAMMDPESIKFMKKLIDERVSKELNKRDINIFQEVRKLVSQSSPGTMNSNYHALENSNFGQASPLKNIDLLRESVDEVDPSSFVPEKDSNSPQYGNNPLPLLNRNAHALPSIKKIVPEKNLKSENGGVHYPHCRSLVYSPTDPKLYSNSHDAECHHRLELQHVYGYNGTSTKHGSRNIGQNILFLSDGRIIFPAASLVVVMNIGSSSSKHNKRSTSQGFFGGHNDDVNCLAVDPISKTIVASGQSVNSTIGILLWDSSIIVPGTTSSTDLANLIVPSSIKSVTGLNFSDNGKLILAFGFDEQHHSSIFLYQYSSEAIQRNSNCVICIRTGMPTVDKVIFNPHLYYDEEKMKNEIGYISSCYTIISIGGKQIKFWTLKKCMQAIESSVEEAGGRRNSNVDKSVSSFKGRKLYKRKSEQLIQSVFVMEGNACLIPSSQKFGNKGNKNLEIAGLFTSNDEMKSSSHEIDNPMGRRKSSRIFTGTTGGSILIWQHLEESIDDHGKAVPSNTNNLKWQPKGKLLSVITDVHDSSIVELSYFYQREFNSEWVVSSGIDGVLSLWKLNPIKNEDQSVSNLPPLEFIESIVLDENDYISSVVCTSSNPSNKSKPSTNFDFQAILGSAQNSISLLRCVIPMEEGQDQGPSLSLQPVMHCHNHKVKRIAVHPIVKAWFVTLASDNVIRFWDGITFRLMHHFKVTESAINDNKNLKGEQSSSSVKSASCVCFSPEGVHLSVGTENGELLLFQSRILQKILASMESVEDASNQIVIAAKKNFWELVGIKKFSSNISRPSDKETGLPHVKKVLDKNSPINFKKYEITEISYHPDGKMLGVATKENLVHVLRIDLLRQNQKSSSDKLNRESKYCFKHVAICRGHAGFVKNIQFSSNGDMFQSTDSTKEILFWDCKSGQQITNPNIFRNAQWTHWSSVCGWPVQGIFNGSFGPINSTSEVINCARQSPDGSLVVVGGTNTVHNCIKLFNFPCLTNAIPSIHGGHTSPVLDIAFIVYNKSAMNPSKSIQNKAHALQGVVSIGGNDCTLFQWKVVPK